MNDKVAVMGDYVDIKWLHGLKVARVYVEIPIEESDRFIELFKRPDKASPVKVVIARLAEDVAEPLPSAAQAASTPTAPTEVKTRTPFRDMPRSQQAALKCQDGGFQEWIKRKYYTAWHEVPLCDEEPENAANETLKAVCGIKSKKDLDAEGPSSRMWDQLRATFDNRDLIR